jgi:hypothetical protein
VFRTRRVLFTRAAIRHDIIAAVVKRCLLLLVTAIVSTSMHGGVWRGFSPPRRYPVTASRVVIVRDLNRDGRPDLVLSGNQVDQFASFSILVNEGDGTFGNEQLVPSALGEKIEDAADINGDGMPDLLASNYFQNGISIYRSTGALVFGAQEFHGTATHGGPSQVIDYDGDGVPDVVSLSFGSANPVRVHLFRGRRDGSLESKVTLNTDLAVGASASTRILNGELEILVSERSGNLGLIRLKKTGIQVERLYAGPGFDLSCVFADVNGDGVPDIIDTSDEVGSSEPVFVTLGDADGTFLERKRISQQRHLSFPVKVRAGDIDGDGAIDLVITDFQSTTLSLFLGDGHGNFSQPPIALDAGAPINDFELADLNGDGTLDVVTANDDHTASILKNLGRPARHRAVRP